MENDNYMTVEGFMSENCMVCQRIERIKKGENPYFVKELETGYVVIGDFQRFRGYTIFICKECQPELHLLEPEFRKKFLEEMSVVGEAVYNAFKPDKLNYELLGAGNAVHMHWHFFPRRAGDTPVKGPVWRLEQAEMYAEKYRPTPEELEEHLLDRMEDYENEGMSREEAQRSAVRDMGDAVVIGTKLNEIHSIRKAPGLHLLTVILSVTGFLFAGYMQWTPEQEANASGTGE